MLALWKTGATFTTTIVAKIPKITRTAINSINVNPFFNLFIIYPKESVFICIIGISIARTINIIKPPIKIITIGSRRDKNTDLLLYMAARNENIVRLKKSYRKKVIIIDRFTDSTLAYQHYGMGISKQLIKSLNRIIVSKKIISV